MLHFDNQGLIPVVVQDYKDNTVLMVAYMNEQAINKTITTGRATFWSRSRKKLWIKGEQSGNIQELKEFYYDCDYDCILIKVNQVGIGAACHTGYRSCFFSKINLELITKTGDIISEYVGKKLFEPNKIYKKKI
jgi:phosphoribosyl-AMP cyclohydrolase